MSLEKQVLTADRAHQALSALFSVFHGLERATDDAVLRWVNAHGVLDVYDEMNDNIDTFVERNLPNDNNSLFDFLSIDVEGFDFAVLMGGPQLLQRTKYIEFEYNWKGQWKDHKLSAAIDMLKDTGFVCYWAGAYGHIWRITDCWLDYYDLKFWSNVACVNMRIPEAAPLTARMEELFQETLDAGQTIQYNTQNTSNTDGGFLAVSDANNDGRR